MEQKKKQRIKSRGKYAYVGTTAGKWINYLVFVITFCIFLGSGFCTMILLTSESDVYTTKRVDYYMKNVDNNGQIAEICEYYQFSTQKESLTEYQSDLLEQYQIRYSASETNLRFFFSDQDEKIVFASDDPVFLKWYEKNKQYTSQVVEKIYLNKKRYQYSEDIILTVFIMNPDYTGVHHGIYETEYKRVKILYLIKDLSLVGLPVGGVIAIASFILLMYGAGRKKEHEEVVLEGIHKIPFDVIVFVNLMIGSFLYLMFNSGQYSSLAEIVIGCLAVCLLTSFVVTFVARYKAGHMLDNTLIKKWFWDSQSKKNQKYRMGVVLGIVILYFLLFMYMETHSNDGILLFIFLYFVIAAILLKMMVDFGRLEKQMEQINQGNLDHNRIEAFMLPWMRHFSEELEHVGEGLKAAVDEQMKSEHFKTELITNVSHDIKTPLTSIINYVDLLKNGTETTEEREEYLAVLDRQSKKLKKMTEDLVQFSKANTGNLELFMEHMHVDVLLEQVLGEYAEKLKEKKLEIIISLHRRNQDQKEIRIFSGDEIQIETEEGSTVVDDSFMIQGDGRYVWRILDNLFGNLYKYAMDGTRVYIDLVEKEQEIQISIKNTSKNPLNISGEELKERFVRGDSSRNTEGSGLGLSIAESFTVLMGGSFDVYVDGDFFKVSISFLKTDHTLE